jgi:hypothetical protein
MSTVAAFLHIGIAFDTTWHSGLLHKLSEFEFSTSIIKLIASYLTERKFKVCDEDEFSMPRKIVTAVPHVPVLAPILYSLYTNDAPRGTWNPSCSVR